MDLISERGRPNAPARVDIVVPVYNEEAALPRSIPTLCAYLETHGPQDWRVVIADNASTDRTRAVVERLAARHPRISALHLARKGRGRALRAAWLAPPADVVPYMDVDLSTDLSAFRLLIGPLLRGEADLAIVSRLADGTDVTRRWKWRTATAGSPSEQRLGRTAAACSGCGDGCRAGRLARRRAYGNDMPRSLPWRGRVADPRPPRRVRPRHPIRHRTCQILLSKEVTR